MTRVKGGIATHKKHKKIVTRAKGYRGHSSKLYSAAKNALSKAGVNAYIGRKRKKRDFRSLWITRISAACKAEGVNYSRLTHGLLKAKVALDRKVLADLAVNHPEIFKQVVEIGKAELK